MVMETVFVVEQFPLDDTVTNVLNARASEEYALVGTAGPRNRLLIFQKCAELTRNYEFLVRWIETDPTPLYVPSMSKMLANTMNEIAADGWQFIRTIGDDLLVFKRLKTKA